MLLTALAGLGLVYAVKSCNKKYLTAAVAAMALFFNLALIPTVAVPLSGLRSGRSSWHCSCRTSILRRLKSDDGEYPHQRYFIPGRNW
ncbi:MAG: hypothetical protein ACLR2G_01070 [Phascolarctobacterium faecium]